MPEQEHIFESERKVDFRLEPGEQLEISITYDRLVTLYLRPMDKPDAATPVVPESSTPEPPPESTPQEPATVAPEEAQKQERVNLAGLVGRAPVLRTTRKGRLVASFPLGVHPDQDTTTWHHVVAFDKRAETVRDQVQAGDAVEVVGYRHPRERRPADGNSSPDEQIYAVAVRHRKPKEAPSSPTPLPAEHT